MFFESLVAAIYLDGGDQAARKFITDSMGPEIDLAVEGEVGNNYKSLLQQLAQRERGATPTYQLLDEKGPDHSKCFKVAAQIGSMRYQPAWGKKQERGRAAGRPKRAKPIERQGAAVSFRIATRVDCIGSHNCYC